MHLDTYLCIKSLHSVLSDRDITQHKEIIKRIKRKNAIKATANKNDTMLLHDSEIKEFNTDPKW